MGTEADRVVGIYRRHAAAFDRQRTRSLFERPWLDRFVAALPAGRTVLDLGCGSGEPISRYLVEPGCAITGVDTSPALLALCRARFPDQTWIEGDMRELALGRHFDGLIAWDSFFFLTPAEQRRMFATFRVHLRDDGALMFTSGPAHGERIGSFEGESLYHASLAPDEYRALLERHGFAVRCHIAEDPDCDLHTVWLAKLRPAES
jgi:cyclopropane fatty-acyl-phospholipid synthase-like methyltransferase